MFRPPFGAVVVIGGLTTVWAPTPAGAAPSVTPEFGRPGIETALIETVGWRPRYYWRHTYPVPYVYYAPAYGTYVPPPAYAYPPAYGAYPPPAAAGGYGNYPPPAATGDYGNYPPPPAAGGYDGYPPSPAAGGYDGYPPPPAAGDSGNYPPPPTGDEDEYGGDYPAENGY